MGGARGNAPGDLRMAHVVRQVFGADRLAARDDPGVVHRVGQFADVPFHS